MACTPNLLRHVRAYLGSVPAAESLALWLIKHASAFCTLRLSTSWDHSIEIAAAVGDGLAALGADGQLEALDLDVSLLTTDWLDGMGSLHTLHLSCELWPTQVSGLARLVFAWARLRCRPPRLLRGCVRPQPACRLSCLLLQVRFKSPGCSP